MRSGGRNAAKRLRLYPPDDAGPGPLEVAGAVSRRTQNIADAHAAASQLHTLPFLQLIPLEASLVQDATDLAADLGLRGADALYVALARQLGVPLVSFDHEQLTRPALLILTIQP